MMKDCRCYHDGRCFGTKEMDPVSCDGNPQKCKFNFLKKELNLQKDKMNTAEMWVKAQEDGKFYKCYDVAYCRDYGFVDANDLKTPWFVEAVGGELDDFLKIQGWKEMNNIISKSDAEEKLQMKIID